MGRVTEAAKKYVEQLKVVEQVERSYRLDYEKEATLYHATLDYEKQHLLRLREELIEVIEKTEKMCHVCYGHGVVPDTWLGSASCWECGGSGARR